MVARSGSANSTQSNLSIAISVPSGQRAQSHPSAHTTQSPHSPSSASDNDLGSSCQITVLPEMALSPLIGNLYPMRAAGIASSSPQSTLQVKEVRPPPEKVGEIGYVASTETGLPSVSTTSDPTSTQNTRHDNLSTHLRSLPSERSGSSWSPARTGLSPYADHSRGNPAKPSEKLTASKMLLRPILLVFFGLVVLIATFVGFLQVQERINSNNKNNKNHSTSLSNSLENLSDWDNHTSTRSANSTDTSSGGNTGNNYASFVYLGTIFIVALLIEFWIFVGTLRRLYHRLGLWIDQEYPLILPDLSDPEAPVPPTPLLPLWARILRIEPQAVRPPLLPPYVAVLNMIRTGGRSEVNLEGTGDVEDGEVIRTLAIGQGQAAPAFNGEEFKKSTIILSGPPKRNSVSSVSPSVRSTSEFFMKLSRSLTGRFSSRNSTTSHENEANPSSSVPR